jgi:hypothetical protein
VNDCCSVSDIIAITVLRTLPAVCIEKKSCGYFGQYPGEDLTLFCKRERAL